MAPLKPEEVVLSCISTPCTIFNKGMSYGVGLLLWNIPVLETDKIAISLVSKSGTRSDITYK